MEDIIYTAHQIFPGDDIQSGANRMNFVNRALIQRNLVLFRSREMVNKIAISDSLLEFAKRAYEHHDEAHSFQHAMKVYENALTILREEVENDNISLNETEVLEFPFVMLGHDFRDHKLVDKGVCLSQEEITEFYRRHLSEESVQKILYIHDNCSWSNRLNSQPLAQGDWIRKLLQDADWLEALGETGIQRCYQFRAFKRGVDAPPVDEMEINSKVYDHCLDKLVKIPAELNYGHSIQIVKDKFLLFPIVRFCLNHEAADPTKEHALFKQMKFED